MPTKTALRERIYDQIPGYRTALERERTMRTLAVTQLHTVGNLGDVNVDYYNRITNAVDSGATDLTDLRDSYADEVTALQARAGFHQLCVHTMQQARTDADTALTEHTDTALEILQTELDTLFTDVDNNRTIVEAHPDSAEQAIALGANGTKNWQLVSNLLTRYDEIRAEHRHWVLRQSGGNQNMPGFAACGQIRRFLEVDPTWLLRRATTAAPSMGAQNAALTGWFTIADTIAGIDPADNNRNDIWPVTHRPSQWLLIVADNEPWVPDADTITACHTAAEELFRNAPQTNASWSLSRLATLTEHGAITDLQPANA